MRLSTEVPEIARWPDVRGPLHIACSRDAMEQLRRRALTGLKAPPVAGFGVGGLLLGEREGSSVRVLDSLALECSHSLGPPFRLTPPEVRRSRELILANGALPVIGWYFSRTQGELELSRAEVALFEELFPSQWQITLLLLPDAGGSARAAFFFREPAGDMVKAAEEIMRPWLPSQAARSAASAIFVQRRSAHKPQIDLGVELDTDGHHRPGGGSRGFHVSEFDGIEAAAGAHHPNPIADYFSFTNSDGRSSSVFKVTVRTCASSNHKRVNRDEKTFVRNGGSGGGSFVWTGSAIAGSAAELDQWGGFLPAGESR